jgi:N-acetylglucosamine-6-sulfatase
LHLPLRLLQLRQGAAPWYHALVLRATATLVFILVCTLAVPCASSLAQEQQDTTKPNIVFVLADDLDAQLAEEMPVITARIRDEGVSLTRAYNTYPLCCPSRTTILTGQYAHNHNVKSNSANYNGGYPEFKQQGLSDEIVALDLQQAGYRTGYFGKYLNGYSRGVPPGWDEWVALKEGAFGYYDFTLVENGREKHHKGEYQTDVIAKKAGAFISSPDEEPFFAFVAPYAPHAPATPARRHEGRADGMAAPRPPSFNEADVSDKPGWVRSKPRVGGDGIDKSYRKRYEAMLAVDEMVDVLLDDLAARGEMGNTYIFFASDNGWHQGEHRIRAGKRTPYEESARTPLYVRGPGVAAGVETSALVANTDYAPTIAEIASVPFIADGRSLLPLLTGGAQGWRSGLLLESFKHNTSPPPYKGVVTQHYKYVEYQSGARELYDLVADPYELENSIEVADPALVAGLATKLDALRRCASASCRAAEDAP